jgi:Cof subfamily protein (haloacid dehalogenase superfamily)
MLLAFDLDGTLLTRDYRLNRATLAAIRAARRKGHLVTVITGRTAYSAKPFLERLELSGLYGLNHGASVVNAKGGVLFQAALESCFVREVLARYSHRVECWFTVGEKVYVRDTGDAAWAWLRDLDHQLLAHHAYQGEAPEKVILRSARRTRAIHHELLGRYPDLTYYLWSDSDLEITGKDGHKGAALKRLAKTLGVPQKETVAFGDGINDIAMLRWAGHSVAVGEGLDAGVLAVADERVAAPEEHGVASWLEANL